MFMPEAWQSVCSEHAALYLLFHQRAGGEGYTVAFADHIDNQVQIGTDYGAGKFGAVPACILHVECQ